MAGIFSYFKFLKLPLKTINMKPFVILLFICITITVNAQQKIVFTNADSSKTITIKQKDLVRLSYNGYMQQPQQAEGFVTALNDSTITLSPRKRLLQKRMPGQTLFIKDITGFRRYSKFRPAAEIIYGFVGIGIAGTATALVSNANLSTVLGFAAAAGTAIVTTGLRNAFFSSKIKNSLNSGWSMQLLPAQ
jgi:hypothetical protein